MNEETTQLKNEFKNFINNLTTDICKEIFIKDLKDINSNLTTNVSHIRNLEVELEKSEKKLRNNVNDNERTIQNLKCEVEKLKNNAQEFKAVMNVQVNNFQEKMNQGFKDACEEHLFKELNVIIANFEELEKDYELLFKSQQNVLESNLGGLKELLEGISAHFEALKQNISRLETQINEMTSFLNTNHQEGIASIKAVETNLQNEMNQFKKQLLERSVVLENYYKRKIFILTWMVSGILGLLGILTIFLIWNVL